jgi:hypothetical protein
MKVLNKKEKIMKKRITSGLTIGSLIAPLALTVLYLGGCATFAPEKPKTLVPTDRGTVIFLDKYEFIRPPAGWALLRNLEGGDFELGFITMEAAEFPSQTTFIYDAEPYGSSQELERRAEQYCTRFLFNSGILPQIQKKEKVQVMGQPALALYLEGENPNRNEKSKSTVYLVKRGDRIISFVCTQWRPLNGAWDPQAFVHFEKFVNSFKFLKKTFYESFDEKLKELKG